MPTPANATATERPTRYCVVVFDSQCQIGLVSTECGSLTLPLVGEATDDRARRAADALSGQVGAAVTTHSITTAGDLDVRFCTLDAEVERPQSWAWFSVRELRIAAHAGSVALAPDVHAVLRVLQPHLIRVPYLNFGDSDYLFRFRTEVQRNRAVYSSDERGRAIYQSVLCEAIKAAKRQKERTASEPAMLDFGPVRYVLPSHFGFCLGVQNAIERAYETIAENPGRRVYMISELIHNPFVNEDLRQRGLIYLQSDRSVHLRNPETGREYWDELVKGDIVLTPAFGATDGDKVKLIERGISVIRYDATCMLVEKVWKAARRFALAGFTIVIHGKSEHEETKATFSNCAKHGPSVIIRDRSEAEALAGVIHAPTREEKERLFEAFAGKHSDGFDVVRDLDRIAVVNQTTLLRDETVGIIAYLEDALAKKFGAGAVASHLHPKSRGDTLCYATQVNQDALERALAAGADVAIVVGGRNSSNTYQLFRICEKRFGHRAFYIQSESHIVAHDRIVHYRFPYKPGTPGAGETEERTFFPSGPGPFTVLVTGGASCPDGIIQQVINRINGLFDPATIRPVADVLAEVL